MTESPGGGDKNKDDSYSSVTQLAAWGLPALQTVSVLVARLVDADELLGNVLFIFKNTFYTIILLENRIIVFCKYFSKGKLLNVYILRIYKKRNWMCQI